VQRLAVDKCGARGERGFSLGTLVGECNAFLPVPPPEEEPLRLHERAVFGRPAQLIPPPM